MSFKNDKVSLPYYWRVASLNDLPLEGWLESLILLVYLIPELGRIQCFKCSSVGVIVVGFIGYL